MLFHIYVQWWINLTIQQVNYIYSKINDVMMCTCSFMEAQRVCSVKSILLLRKLGLGNYNFRYNKSYSFTSHVCSPSLTSLEIFLAQVKYL